MYKVAVLHEVAMRYNEFQRLKNFLPAPGENESTVDKRNRGSRMSILKKSLNGFGPGVSYEVLDVFGKLQKLRVPDVPPKRILMISLRGIVQISKTFSAGKGSIDKDMQARLYELKTLPISRHELQKACAPKYLPWKFWKDSWNTGIWHQDGKFFGRNTSLEVVKGDYPLEWQSISKLSTQTMEDMKRCAAIWKTLSNRLKLILRKHSAKLLTVDKVICFALGPLSAWEPRSFVQHLAAATVAETLTEMRRAKGIFKSVITFSQDPAYCDDCVAILKDDLNIHATSLSNNFSRVDVNTFVIALAPTGPICPIIADLTISHNGPAAMLCDEIVDDYMEPQYKDQRWIDNTVTKNLVKYKERCAKDYFGDAMDFMGRSWEQFEARYPTVPAQMLEKSPGQIAMKEEARREYSKAAKCSFRDAWVYVRR